jgi:hypothetical protein
MSEKTKHILSVAVFVAIVLVMAAITFADGPHGWGRLPFLLMALLVLSAYGHTLHEWQHGLVTHTVQARVPPRILTSVRPERAPPGRSPRTTATNNEAVRPSHTLRLPLHPAPAALTTRALPGNPSRRC